MSRIETFKEYCKRVGLSTYQLADGRYLSPSTSEAFEAWKAAIDSISSAVNTVNQTNCENTTSEDMAKIKRMLNNE